uniref:Immunoglobulin V-set domain-containing protein n=1 Tax=Echeneis naucrates TaxID=173247 RepID=A0A665V1S9_ECHNA
MCWYYRDGPHSLAAPSVEMTPLITHGHVGKNVSFTCTGWSTWFNIQNNVKYICRSPCLKDNDIIIKAAFGKSERKGRLYIFNKGNSLTVTLTDLKPSDSQTFVCGIERFFKDSFQEVKLNVTAEKHAVVELIPPFSLWFHWLGTMPYLVTGVIMLTIMLIALTILRETVKRQLCKIWKTQLHIAYITNQFWKHTNKNYPLRFCQCQVLTANKTVRSW